MRVNARLIHRHSEVDFNEFQLDWNWNGFIVWFFLLLKKKTETTSRCLYHLFELITINSKDSDDNKNRPDIDCSDAIKFSMNYIVHFRSISFTWESDKDSQAIKLESSRSGNFQLSIVVCLNKNSWKKKPFDCLLRSSIEEITKHLIRADKPNRMYYSNVCILFMAFQTGKKYRNKFWIRF